MLCIVLGSKRRLIGGEVLAEKEWVQLISAMRMEKGGVAGAYLGIFW